ncbi:MAG: CBS domain-containing protein [Nitrospirae bacterium]|nr:CBS domain-containing protein [Candidatus Manganitrophaceae bacterium]
MSLKELMHSDIKKTEPMTTLVEAARMMRRYKIGSVFVEEEGRYVGIITESDLVRKALTKEVSLETPARSLMHAPLIDIDIGKSPIEANHLMHLNGIRHLAVSEQGKIVGMISVRDLVRHFSMDKKSPVYSMADIVKPLTVLVRRDIQTIEAGATAQAAAIRMDEKKIGSLMITDEGRYVGIVTETDLVRKVIGYGLTASKIPVGVIMNTPVLDIDLSRTIQEANEIMATKGVRHLAVTEGGAIIGILSIRDLIGMISIRDLPRFLSNQK